MEIYAHMGIVPEKIRNKKQQLFCRKLAKICRFYINLDWSDSYGKCEGYQARYDHSKELC